MHDTRRDFLAKGAAAMAGLAAATLAGAAHGGTSSTPGPDAGLTKAQEVHLKRYVIERDIPGIGQSTAKQLCDISATSDSALAKLAPTVQWEHSYVADNKTFCVYLADSEDAIRKHGEISGFPVSKITLIDAIIDPTTANGMPA